MAEQNRQKSNAKKTKKRHGLNVKRGYFLPNSILNSTLNPTALDPGPVILRRTELYHLQTSNLQGMNQTVLVNIQYCSL